MANHKILLDVDNCIADFNAHAFKVHGKDPTPVTEWEFWKDMGLTKHEFFAPMDYNFWASLEWTEDGREIIDIIEFYFKKDNICLLTSPVPTHGCLDGKRRWIETNIPEYLNKYLIGSSKHFCAHDQSILIDDYDLNTETFREHGGNTILIPRSWNKNKDKDPLSHLKTMCQFYTS